MRLLNLFAYFTLIYLISPLDAVAPTVTIYCSYRRMVNFLYILFTYRRGLTYMNSIIYLSPMDLKSISKLRGPLTRERSRRELCEVI